MDRYEGEIYEVPEFIPADDEDDTDLLLEGPDPEDDGLVYDLRTHAYVYDSHGDKHEAEPILRPAITWGEVEQIAPAEALADWVLELLAGYSVVTHAGAIVPRAPWERPEDIELPQWPDYDEPVWSDVIYRVDVRFSNGVAAVISFPSVEARDAFLSGEDIENYRIEGEDL